MMKTLTEAGNVFKDLRDVKLYPSVGMKKQPPVHLRANFGQEPFVFDIDGMVKVGARSLEIYTGKLTIRSMKEHRFSHRLTPPAPINCNPG